MKKANIQDVATLAQVSKSSVSRYVNNPTSVNEDYQKRISKAIKQLDYLPSVSARNLRVGKTNIVGFVQPDITQDLFGKTMKCLNKALYKKDCLLISCDTDNDEQKEGKLINSLLQQDAMAIIVVTCGTNKKFLQELVKKTDKLILFIRSEPDVHCDSILEDQTGNAYRLAKHMIGKGHKKFGIIYGVPYSAATKCGLSGFKMAFDEYSITISDSDVIGNCLDFESSRTAADKILNQPNPPTCILYINQRSTQGVYKAVKSYNAEHGTGVEPAGFVSITAYKELDINFPAIVEDADAVGNVLADFVINKIFNSDKKQATKLLIESKLIDASDKILANA